MKACRFKANIFFIILIAPIGCAMNNSSYWEIIKLEIIPTSQRVSSILGLRDSTIIMVGEIKIKEEEKSDIRNTGPILSLSNNNGQTWRERTNFTCNKLIDIFNNGTTLIISGIRYVGTPIKSELVYYKYDLLKDRWEEINLPPTVEGRFPAIIDSKTYLFDISQNQFGNTYIKTNDGGTTWERHTVFMNNKRDRFSGKCIQDTKLWGIRTHYSIEDSINDKDFQSLIAIDLNTWKVIEEIPLGETTRDKDNHTIDTHWIADIKVINSALYLLGQNQQTGTGYVWRKTNQSQLITEDTFELNNKQLPKKLFFYQGQFIIVYTDVSYYLPSYVLLHKNANETSWRKEAFPALPLPCLSFDNGVLMGIAEGDKIYYHIF